MSEDARTDRGTDAEEHPTDEEQTRAEWHFWLIGLLVLGGALLVVFPSGFWPEIGIGLIGLGAVAWIAKTLIERTE